MSARPAIAPALIESVLSIDPGKATGWAHWPSDDAGTLRLKGEDGAAFREFGRRFDERLLSVYQPDMIVVERQILLTPRLKRKPGQKSNIAIQTGKYAAGVYAIVFANAGEILVDDPAPQEWQRWAKRHLGWVKTSDVEDARALLAYALAVRAPQVEAA